jgi:hypothetical protein
MKKHSAALLMLALALVCLVIHFTFGWQAFQDEASEHNTSAQMGDYLIQWIRDVFENLQSEFLQLFFQFLLLASAFKFMQVEVYEQDVEDVKQQLTRIEKRLEKK